MTGTIGTTIDTLRFATAGSVDDGKSTLVGRLLHDSKSVLTDQLAAVEHASRSRGQDTPDLALLTDGLRAEREQGITIDVAYRYFATPRRRFILADTPGHVQYTRNMVTGASTAELAIVLVDARNGVVEQTRRHAAIAALLRVPHVVLAVNKMDLVGYVEKEFDRIVEDFAGHAAELGLPGFTPIPVSALVGDNVVDRSARMDWYEGPALLEFLGNVPVGTEAADAPTRFPVQYVIRDGEVRYYAGQLVSGSLRVGDHRPPVRRDLRDHRHRRARRRRSGGVRAAVGRCAAGRPAGRLARRHDHRGGRRRPGAHPGGPGGRVPPDRPPAEGR
ncbi:sulfate adenylyltransferase large subunit [Streptomyces sp. V4I2]|nr:sulfate adenylyltransferase large subunit [Streptomyces sp. V4I2]